MRAVDTSAWIEWLIRSPAGKQVGELLPTEANWIVPTIVQLELAKWEERLWPDPDEGMEALAFSRTCFVIPLDTVIALRAAALGQKYRLATADPVVYATASLIGADLLTCDAHFEGLPGVIYIDKRTG